MRQPKHGGTGRLAAPTFSMTAIVGLNHDTQTAHNITLLPFCTFYMMRTVNFFSLTKVDELWFWFWSPRQPQIPPLLVGVIPKVNII